jgi:hypothetical protein
MRNYRVAEFRKSLAVLVMALLGAQASAVEILPATELAEHCGELTIAGGPTENSGRFCSNYVRGFIDGAVATDVRVMMNVEAEYELRRSLTERAVETRMPGRHEQQRAAGYAEFCLGNPVPLREVVQKVAQHLEDRLATMDTSLAARDVVYAALRANYPC